MFLSLMHLYQLFWQIPFSLKMAITSYLCVHINLIDKLNGMLKWFPVTAQPEDKLSSNMVG